MKKKKIFGITLGSLATLMLFTKFGSLNASAETNDKSNSSYFMYDNQVLPNGATVSLNKEIAIKENMTIKDILNEAEKTVTSNGYVTQEDVKKELKEQGVSVTSSRILGKPTGFTITLKSLGNDGKYTTVKIPFGTGQSSNTAGSDILKATYTEDNKDKSETISGKIFLIDENTEFNPLNFKASNGNTYKVDSSDKAEVKVVSNTVDPTKANSWGVVTVSTTTEAGKETQASYAVYVRNDKPVRLNVPYYTSVYGLSSVENNNFLNDPATIRRGTEIYIGKNFMDAGSETYNSISTKSLAIADNKEKASWMSTADLLTDAAPIEAVEKTVMHRSLVYSEGGSSKFRHIAAFKKVTVEKEPYTFKGVKYYKIIDAPDYIKVANVDGTKRTLKHNAYIYATSTKRADRTVLKKGSTVITYGGSYKFKNGKRYYRIQGATATKKRYVKAANFE